MPKIEFIFSEFHGKNVIDDSQVLKYFPEAKLTFFNEKNTPPAFDTAHPRFGWRQHDYTQLKGMLASTADIVVALDADMKIISPEVKTIIPLTEAFGFCLPANPRLLVRTDTLIGTDSDNNLDRTNGNGYAFNTAIMAFDTHHDGWRAVLKEATNLIHTQPMRLPLVLWRACLKLGSFPCLLPPQWCVCEGQEGCKNEIILHVGHEKVREFYKGKYAI